MGGGSALDSAKAIREFALSTNPYADVALIAIPTTSGTGSEVTSFAVVNDTEAKIKYPLIAPSLSAEEAQAAIREALAVQCARVLADAGVYKNTPEGNAGVMRFMESIGYTAI